MDKVWIVQYVTIDDEEHMVFPDPVVCIDEATANRHAEDINSEYTVFDMDIVEAEVHGA